MPARDLTAIDEAERYPEGAAGSARRVARVYPRLMGAAPGVGTLVVAADQEGGDGKPFEVLARERRVAVDGRELGVCLAPGLLREERAPSLNQVGCSHRCHRRRPRWVPRAAGRGCRRES